MSIELADSGSVLIAKVGLDGHDRGALIAAKALREEGFQTYYSGIRRTPTEIAKLAVKYNVDCIGLSSLAGAHLALFPKVMEQVRHIKWDGIVIAGGIIPPGDEPYLRSIGIQAVFHPHQPIAEAAEWIRSHLHASRATIRKIR
jgi:methylmalonyl-CoA mutase C-terminal domain/subunit